jgi:hypothetical protein
MGLEEVIKRSGVTLNLLCNEEVPLTLLDRLTEGNISLIGRVHSGMLLEIWNNGVKPKGFEVYVPGDWIYAPQPQVQGLSYKAIGLDSRVTLCGLPSELDPESREELDQLRAHWDYLMVCKELVGRSGLRGKTRVAIDLVRLGLRANNVVRIRGKEYLSVHITQQDLSYLCGLARENVNQYIHSILSKEKVGEEIVARGFRFKNFRVRKTRRLRDDSSKNPLALIYTEYLIKVEEAESFLEQFGRLLLRLPYQKD